MSERILGFFGKYRFLSNFHEHEGVEIFIDGLDGEKIACKNNEAAFQASKTVDIDERFAVAHAKDKDGNLSPAAAKKEGRKVTPRPDWEQVKLDVMLKLLMQKFSHPYYKELLLSTGDAELIEDNTWHDTYWGMCDGVGENHLGRLLMQVREALR